MFSLIPSFNNFPYLSFIMLGLYHKRGKGRKTGRRHMSYRVGGAPVGCSGKENRSRSPGLPVDETEGSTLCLRDEVGADVDDLAV